MNIHRKIKSLIEGIQKQIIRVKTEDSFLFFPPRVYEGAISHKLAIYLQNIFPKYNVDVEYDKYGSSARKELDDFKNFCTNNSTDRIRPDIIVHLRGILFGNMIALEIKDSKSSKLSKDCVNEKLKRLTDRSGRFGYLVGVLWLFGETDKEELIFYINGTKYDSKLYDDMNAVFEVLYNYEISSTKHYQNFLKSVNDLKHNFRKIIKTQEEIQGEEERKEQEEKSRLQEMADSETVHSSNISNSSDADIYDIYQETGVWEGPSEAVAEEDIEPSYEPPEESEEENIQGLEEQQDEQAKYEYIQGAVEEYKLGLLYEKYFYYVSCKENDSKSRELWLDAWQNLYFLSTNSVLFDRFYCIKKIKELLEIGLDYDQTLSIFDDEKRQAEEDLKFLMAWIEYNFNK